MVSPTPATAPENQVKAAFLYNFARFVDWPEGALEEMGEVFRIGVMGDEALADAVDRAIEGKSAHGRSVVVQRPHDPEDLGGYHLLFIAASENRRLEEIFDALHGRPVLTVGETDRFARLGGMIRFRIADVRLRFEVNLRAAADPGLRVSSRLLSVASAVTGEAPGES